MRYLLITILLWSCKKGQQSLLPNVNVMERIWLDSPSNIDLKIIGGYIVIRGGLNGIIVYRLDNDTFLAYENTCPNINYLSYCSQMKVKFQKVVCPCDKSEFLLMTGEPLSKKNYIPLKKYFVNYNKTLNYIDIIN